MSFLPVELLGNFESASAFQAYLSNLGASSSKLERKDYLIPPPSISYRNLKPCGVSFQFQRSATPETTTTGEEKAWTCAAIDLYNPVALDRDAKHKCGYAAYPVYPLCLSAIIEPSSTTKTTSNEAKPPPIPTGYLEITPQTTAREFVIALGEPLRKGGGEALAGGGASGLGPGVWLEWKLELRTPRQADEEAQENKEVMLMVELAGNEARGAGRWEADKAAKATWGILTISLPDQQT